MDLDDFNLNDVAATKKSIQDMEEELAKLTAEEALLRQQLVDNLKENETVELEIQESRREKEQLLEKNKSLKQAWNEIAQNLRTEKSNCVDKTKRLSSLLDVSFKIQQTSDLVWDIKISADAQHDRNFLILKYLKEIDRFELITMNPTHPNLVQIKEYFSTNNDVVGLLCTTRSYFKQCAKKQKNSEKPCVTVTEQSDPSEEK